MGSQRLLEMFRVAEISPAFGWKPSRNLSALSNLQNPKDHHMNIGTREGTSISLSLHAALGLLDSFSTA